MSAFKILIIVFAIVDQILWQNQEKARMGSNVRFKLVGKKSASDLPIYVLFQVLTVGVLTLGCSLDISGDLFKYSPLLH